MKLLHEAAVDARPIDAVGRVWRLTAGQRCARGHWSEKTNGDLLTECERCGEPTRSSPGWTIVGAG